MSSDHSFEDEHSDNGQIAENHSSFEEEGEDNSQSESNALEAYLAIITAQIFSRAAFNIHRSVRTRVDVLRQRIKDHGGEVLDDILTPTSRRWIVVIADQKRVDSLDKLEDALLYSPRYEYLFFGAGRKELMVRRVAFVTKCIARRDFVLPYTPPPSQDRDKRLRKDYTISDDEHLARYIMQKFPGRERKGRQSHKFYERLVQLASFSAEFAWASRHPAKSWRERYRKRAKFFDRRTDQLERDYEKRRGGLGLQYAGKWKRTEGSAVSSDDDSEESSDRESTDEVRYAVGRKRQRSSYGTVTQPHKRRRIKKNVEPEYSEEEPSRFQEEEADRYSTGAQALAARKEEEEEEEEGESRIESAIRRELHPGDDSEWRGLDPSSDQVGNDHWGSPSHNNILSEDQRPHMDEQESPLAAKTGRRSTAPKHRTQANTGADSELAESSSAVAKNRPAVRQEASPPIRLMSIDQGSQLSPSPTPDTKRVQEAFSGTPATRPEQQQRQVHRSPLPPTVKPKRTRKPAPVPAIGPYRNTRARSASRDIEELPSIIQEPAEKALPKIYEEDAPEVITTGTTNTFDEENIQDLLVTNEPETVPSDGPEEEEEGMELDEGDAILDAELERSINRTRERSSSVSSWEQPPNKHVGGSTQPEIEDSEDEDESEDEEVEQEHGLADSNHLRKAPLTAQALRMNDVRPTEDIVAQRLQRRKSRASTRMSIVPTNQDRHLIRPLSNLTPRSARRLDGLSRLQHLTPADTIGAYASPSRQRDSDSDRSELSDSPIGSRNSFPAVNTKAGRYAKRAKGSPFKPMAGTRAARLSR